MYVCMYVYVYIYIVYVYMHNLSSWEQGCADGKYIHVRARALSLSDADTA
jgi:hypothetical protein